MFLLLVKYSSGADTKGSKTDNTTCEAYKEFESPLRPDTMTNIKQGVIATALVNDLLKAGAMVQFKKPSLTI